MTARVYYMKVVQTYFENRNLLQQGIEYVGVNNGVVCVYCKLNNIVQ